MRILLAEDEVTIARALVRRSGSTVLDCGQYILKTPLGEARLNSKEYQLAELFFRHPRQVFSSDHLMEKVWGLDSEAEMDVVWTYDGDAAFPVDEGKINDLLSQFQSFGAAFTIENVENFSQYGLDKPVCTIDLTAGEKHYTLQLGDFSKMDEERYISIGDGNAYLAVHDPMEEFDAVLRDMILDDAVPEFDTAQEIRFAGLENYTITRDEEAKSLCESDVYFTDGKPLDTDNVDSLLKQIKNLSLTDQRRNCRR